MIRRWAVQQLVHRLTRTFPTVRVELTRPTLTFDANGQQVEEPVVVYHGEALLAEQGGEVRVYGLGQTEQQSLMLLIAGDRDIRQGDRLVFAGRTYVVSDQPNVWHAFRHVRLEQKGQ